MKSTDELVEKAHRLRRETEALYSGFRELDNDPKRPRRRGVATRLKRWLARVVGG